MSIPFSPQQFEQKPIRTLRRATVRIDKIIATQNKVDPAKVADIARQPASAITTDPIVSPFKGNYLLGDGHNRVAGAIKRGDTKIKVRVAR